MALTLRGILTGWRAWRAKGSTPAPHAAAADPPSGEQASKKRRGKGATATGRTSSSAAGPEAPAPGEAPRARGWLREAGALLLIAAGIYAALALASYRADPLRPEVHGDDWVGPAGALCAGQLVALVGATAWLVPLELALLARPLLGDRPLRWGLVRPSTDVLMAFVAAALVHITWPRGTAFGAMPVGGLVGGAFGELMRGLFSTVGSYLIGLTVVGLILVQRAAFSVRRALERLRLLLSASRRGAGRGLSLVGAAWSRARQIDLADEPPHEALIATPEEADAIIAAFADDGERFEPRRRPAPLAPSPAGALPLSDPTGWPEDGAARSPEAVAAELADATTPSPPGAAEAAQATPTPPAPTGTPSDASVALEDAATPPTP
ncbi:MAG: DNA translocase FtsK 4TM domain-containing protein, partial [Myxococcales bacterium]|nr:DNA translocase FtsK 4TM domain-containing protein [Myxococcales bacterium]